MQGAGYVWIVFLTGTGAGYPAYIAPLIISGIGVSMALPCVSVSGLNAVEPRWLGKAAGMLNTMQLLGGTCGIAIVTVVFNGAGSLAGPAAVTHGFRPAIATSACLSVLGALTALGLRGRRVRVLPGGCTNAVMTSEDFELCWRIAGCEASRADVRGRPGTLVSI